MNIICQLCHKTFNGQITGSHLKMHGTNAVEYREQFGPTQTPEFLHRMRNIGKLGGQEQAAKWHRDARLTRIEKYKNNPKLCEGCKAPIPYDKRRNDSCSQSCSKLTYYASKNVTQRCDRVIEKPCPHCQSFFTKTSKYCSRRCSNLAQRTKTLARIADGTCTQARQYRNYLIQLRGHQCERCKRTAWEGEPIPLQMDHIDGNAFNHALSNLNLLCNNCHGLTPTWGQRNRNNGRKSRLRLLG